MTPPRFDMYAFIHKALRVQMSDTLAACGRLDPNDAEEVAERAAQLRALLDACRSHLAHENEFIHAAIEARAPGAAAVTAGDHDHHRAALKALDAALSTLLAADDVPARAAAAHALYRRLALFVADNFQHMEVEERDNNAALWAHYSDEELVAIHDRLVASIPPQELAAILRWLLPSIAAPERAAVLGDMAQKAPPAVFAGLLQLARQHLSPRDWFKLTLALGPMPMAA